MKKILTLEETAKMMLSEDYKERFKAEYYQLVNRYEGLKLMLKRWDAGTLDFKPACSRGPVFRPHPSCKRLSRNDGKALPPRGLFFLWLLFHPSLLP